ncbi:MAG: ribonuclease III [Proteobacteria bacterium]|nr:ribonuclease III [Pseudomonadota bacterium]MDA0928968.1 ribonuclease III [Pseudomonadota bacterium]
MAVELDSLQAKLSYQFQDPSLATLALTHRSASKTHNERLEFLGDALLDFIIGEILFEKNPEATEGELTRMRAALVKKSSLAEMAKAIGLGDHLLLSKGEAGSGGRRRASVLADTLEALIAAVYLDGGLEQCSALIVRLAGEKLDRPEAVGDKDFKTRLQERMQASGEQLPQYRILETRGEAHAQEFLVECAVAVLPTAQQGLGSSKRIAEQEAARRTLQILDGTDQEFSYDR